MLWEMFYNSLVLKPVLQFFIVNSLGFSEIVGVNIVETETTLAFGLIIFIYFMTQASIIRVVKETS